MSSSHEHFEVAAPQPSPAIPARGAGGWHRSLAEAIRDPEELIAVLQLGDEYREPARRASRLFPVLVPRSYLQRMQPGDPDDPLLRQVLPLDAESISVNGFAADAVGDAEARQVPGLLQKYQGRALLITTGACAIHCRYCFRRHYPYGAEPRRLADWEPAFTALQADPSLREVILSGGDPWMLTDQRLSEFLERLAAIPHVVRIRMHTRLPIVLPDRVTDELLDVCTRYRPRTIVVVHANHPAEIAGECRDALRRLVRAGIPVLNQSVLLRGVNDRADVLAELSERLVDVGVMPYYLHQLDRVAGAAHFEVPESAGLAALDQLRERLPGYAVPRYVREVSGALSKTPVLPESAGGTGDPQSSSAAFLL